MYVDSELGALTFKTVFAKAESLVKKVAPLLQKSPAQPQSVGTIPGTLEPVTLPPPAPERPSWIMPALLVGGSIVAFKIIRKRGRR
jgi:hypothetical protein